MNSSEQQESEVQVLKAWSTPILQCLEDNSTEKIYPSTSEGTGHTDCPSHCQPYYVGPGFGPS
jgi:hypothetical protein